MREVLSVLLAQARPCQGLQCLSPYGPAKSNPVRLRGMVKLAAKGVQGSDQCGKASSCSALLPNVYRPGKFTRLLTFLPC